jgi:hypothetical protein
MSKKFEYSYSAPTEAERKEIESIRRQYVAEEKREETDMEKLRRLDAKVRNMPTMYALIMGVFGILVFGLGLAMVLEWGMMLWGIVVMVVGALPMGLAYPIYQFTLKEGKKKYGAEILELSEKLLNE